MPPAFGPLILRASTAAARALAAIAAALAAVRDVDGAATYGVSKSFVRSNLRRFESISLLLLWCSVADDTAARRSDSGSVEWRRRTRREGMSGIKNFHNKFRNSLSPRFRARRTHPVDCTLQACRAKLSVNFSRTMK